MILKKKERIEDKQVNVMVSAKKIKEGKSIKVYNKTRVKIIRQG